MDKLYSIKNIGVATYGHYRIDTDSKPYITHTLRGKEVKNYKLEYDPSTEIKGIVVERQWYSPRNNVIYKEIARDDFHGIILSPNGFMLLRDWFSKHEPRDIYSYGSGTAYDIVNKNIDAYFIHSITSLSHKINIGEEGKIRLSEIKEYYNKLIGNEQKKLLVPNQSIIANQQLPKVEIKDPVLNLIINAKAKLEASILPEEKKEALRKELFELGNNYHEKKEHFRACSPNYQADRLNLVSECVKKIADIEVELIGKESSDDEDIKNFIKVFK